LLRLCAGVGVAGAAATPFLIRLPWAIYPMLFVWGGTVFGIYTIGLTLLGQRFQGPELAGANAAYVMLYALGLLAGPPLEGVALDWWNPHGLMAVLAASCLIYMAFLTVRRARAA
jgi:predicted MFS family arabinose efflux permease